MDARWYCVAQGADENGKRLAPPLPQIIRPRAVVTSRRRRRPEATTKENDMKLIIFVAVLIYWLLPVDIAPGPIDDIIITLAGALVALAERKEVTQ